MAARILAALRVLLDSASTSIQVTSYPSCSTWLAAYRRGSARSPKHCAARPGTIARRRPTLARPRIHRRAACRRLSRQPMQGLVAGAVIRQLDAVIFAHSTEDFAKPAPSIDDARLRGRYESKRRGLQARIQQWLRGAGRERQADRQTERDQLKPAAPGFRPSPSTPPALPPEIYANPHHLAWPLVGRATRAGAPGDGRAARLPRAPGRGRRHAVPPHAPAIRQLETEWDKLLLALL